jgi:nitric oxide dioxygenase
MTPDQIKLVQSTFSQLAHDPDGVARAFYTRLFEIDPSLRAMFAEDMTEQRGRLMRMIGMAVNGLNRIEALLPTLHELGARHVGYGVKDSHYATVGQALLETLRTGLGHHFSPQVQEAWATAFAAISTTMQAGARQAQSQPA